MNMSFVRLNWLYLHGAIWWWGLGTALLGLALILLGLSIWRSEQRFQEHVLRATAKVTAKEKGLETRETSKGQVQDYSIARIDEGEAKLAELVPSLEEKLKY